MYDEDTFENIDGQSDLTPAARAVIDSDRVEADHLIDRLTGRDGGLRPSKPQAQGDTGLEQYVWRMARFHSGSDPSIPVTAAWDLGKWLDSEGIDAEVSGVTDRAGEEITGILDVIARLCANELTGSAERGFNRWEKALYG